MIIFSKEAILEYVKKAHPALRLIEQTEQICLVYSFEGKEMPLFLRLDPSSGILQLVLFLPCTLIPTAAEGLARLLLYLNNAIDLPGFGMDESSRAIYFRCPLFTAEGRIPEAVLDQLLTSIPKIAQLLFSIISTVAAGLRVETAIPQVNALLKKLDTRGSPS